MVSILMNPRIPSMEAEKLLQGEEEQQQAPVHLGAKKSRSINSFNIFLRCFALFIWFVSYVLIWMLAKSKDEGHQISDYG